MASNYFPTMPQLAANDCFHCLEMNMFPFMAITSIRTVWIVLAIGNALTYHRVDNPKEWIIISEWSMLGSGMVNRRDYKFNYLVGDSQDKDVFSDLPSLTFEPVYFLKLNPEAYGE